MAEQQPTIETEIAALEKTLAEKRAALQGRMAEGGAEDTAHAKEVIREALREKIAATPSAGTPPPPPPSSSAATPPPTIVPPSYLSDELKPKVQEFVNMAFEKSIEHAISLVKATNNPALIDAFHDVMVDVLHDELIRRGKLIPI